MKLSEACAIIHLFQRILKIMTKFQVTVIQFVPDNLCFFFFFFEKECYISNSWVWAGASLMAVVIEIALVILV